MGKIVLPNKVSIIYRKSLGSLTSLAIGFEAGANQEKNFPLGTAHALEHMVYTGTKNLSEEGVNALSDEIFALTNAMTNYSYSIYYGTVRKVDLEKALELFSEILLRPLLLEEAWEKERKVILQELSEWSEDMDQHCEDMALKNSFSGRRLGELIIGTEESIKSITIKDLRRFYNSFYTPENCTITIVTDIEEEEAVSSISRYFGNFIDKYETSVKNIINTGEDHKEINKGYYQQKVNGFNGAKIQYLFDIGRLTPKELYALKVYCEYMGGGTSSILYDSLRTKAAMAYDVKASVKGEKGVEVMIFQISTSKENILKVIEVIDKIIENHYNNGVDFDVYKLQKRLSLKSALETERSIVLAHRLCTHEVMFKDYGRIIKEINGDYNISLKDINILLKRILSKKSIQLIY